MDKYLKVLDHDREIANKYLNMSRGKFIRPLLQERTNWNLTKEHKLMLDFTGAVLNKSASRNWLRNIGKDFIDETEHSITVIDGECGLGKTSVLTSFMKHMSIDWKGIIFVQQAETASSIANDIGKSAIAIISGKGKEKVIEQLKQELKTGKHRVVIMTHEFLKISLRTGTADFIWSHFDSVVIDETFETYNLYSLSYENLNTYLLGVLNKYAHHAKVKPALEYINNIIEKMGILSESDNEVFTRARYSSFHVKLFEDALKVVTTDKPRIGAKPKKDDKGIKILEALSTRKDNEIDFFHIFNGGVNWSFTYNFFPKNVSIVFLFDGGWNEPALRALDKYSDDVKVDFIKLRYRTFEDWSFIIEEDSIGKSSNTLTHQQSVMAVDKLNTLAGDNKLLVVGHKDTIEQFKGINKNISLLNWGKHRSTNKFEDYTNIAVLSWWIQPPHEYSGKYIAHVGDKYQEGSYELADVMAKSVANELNQAIKRISRKPDNKEHKIVYLRVPKSSSLSKAKDFVLEYIKQEFIGAEIIFNQWYEIKNTNEAQAKEWANQIIKAFTESEIIKGRSVFQARELIEQTGINFKTFTKPHKKRLDILLALLNKHNIIYTNQITTRDRDIINLPKGKRLKGWVFKRGFENEEEKVA